jgi:hypothetical protein
LLCPLDRSGTPGRRQTNLLRDKIVRPACSGLGFQVLLREGLVDVRKLNFCIPPILTSSELVIADVTGRNRKVLRDLEVRRVSGRPTIVLVRDGARLPANIAPYPVLIYRLDTPADRLTAQQGLSELVRMMQRPMYFESTPAGSGENLLWHGRELNDVDVSSFLDQHEAGITRSTARRSARPKRTFFAPVVQSASLPAAYVLGHEAPGSRALIVNRRLTKNQSDCEPARRRTQRPQRARQRITLRIFLASSAELRNDCNELDLYLREQNDFPVQTGVSLEIVRWENFLDAMSDTRLQDEYNRKVRACDIFVSLFFTKAGQFTAEELEVAHQQFLKTGRPFIYTFFKNAPRNTGEIGEEIVSLLKLKKKLRDLGHYPTSYNNTEHLKRQLLDQMKKILQKIRGTAQR